MAVADWREVQLEDVADEITVGYVGPMASEYVDDGIPFLRSLNVEPLRINENDLKFITHKFHHRIQKSRLKPGDVVIVRTGKPGTCSVVPEWLSDANCSDLVIVRCGEQLNKRFFAYYVNTVASDHVAAHLVGAVQQHFNVGSARTLRINLPPLPEQKAIVRILATLDDKIELNRRMNETLEAMARAIFKSWFVDFDPVRAKAYRSKPAGMDAATAALFPDSFEDSLLGKIPTGWRICAIRDIASTIQYGLTQSASAEPAGPHFLRITDIQGGQVDWGTVPYCKVSPEEHDRYRLLPGDVLVARTGASTGENIYLVSVPDAVFASYLVRFQFPEAAIARLVGAFMRTAAYFDYVAGCIGGSAQPNASAQVLAGAELPVPSIEIYCRFAELVVPLDRRIAANREEARTLANTRDSLLPRLLSGEVRVKEAESLVEATA